MRVLHLIDSGMSGAAGTPGGWRPADLELRACRALLEHSPIEQTLVLLGPASAARRAAQHGVEPDVLICPPLGRPELAWRMLRRVAEAVRPDVVHCWNCTTTRLARLAFRGMHVHVGCEGLPPPIEVLSRNEAMRASARAAVREEGLGDDVPMLALLGRGEACDALRFLYVLGSLQYAGVRVVGVVPAWAQQVPRAQRYAHRFGSRIRFIVRDAPWREVLAGSDLAIWQGEMANDVGGPGRELNGQSAVGDQAGGDIGVPASWFIAEAQGLGVPVVTAGKDAIRWLYTPCAAEACLAANATPPELARIAMPLVENAQMRGKISRALRDHLAAMENPRRLVAHVEEIWQEKCKAGGAKCQASGL